jgi:hypothetical protein
VVKILRINGYCYWTTHWTSMHVWWLAITSRDLSQPLPKPNWSVGLNQNQSQTGLLTAPYSEVFAVEPSVVWAIVTMLASWYNGWTDLALYLSGAHLFLALCERASSAHFVSPSSELFRSSSLSSSSLIQLFSWCSRGVVVLYNDPYVKSSFSSNWWGYVLFLMKTHLVTPMSNLI